MNGPSPQSGPRPHPLAEELCERLPAGATVLEFGAGRGRNTRALRAARLHVIEIADEAVAAYAAHPESAGAALSTHGLLHGSEAEIARAVREIAHALHAGSPLFATFASTQDARFGRGTRLGAYTFAPESGDEAGVAHSYFDETRLRALLEPLFTIESLQETCADAIVGSWAHAGAPSGTVHWFVKAVRR